MFEQKLFSPIHISTLQPQYALSTLETYGYQLSSVLSYHLIIALITKISEFQDEDHTDQQQAVIW